MKFWVRGGERLQGGQNFERGGLDFEVERGGLNFGVEGGEPPVSPQPSHTCVPNPLLTVIKLSCVQHHRVSSRSVNDPLHVLQFTRTMNETQCCVTKYRVLSRMRDTIAFYTKVQCISSARVSLPPPPISN